MKISINSTYSYIRTNINYGSTLQCYALQKYLKKRGHDPEHLRDYRANPVLILKRLKNIKWFKPFCAKAVAQFEMGRFIKDNIAVSTKGYISEKAMYKNCPKADCFIAGSDQIWRNPTGSRFLNYAPDEAIKLSYAASFGRTSLPKEIAEKIKPWLNRFDGISVREKTAVNIPIFIGELLEQGKMSVKVLKTNDTWYGMTYHEDVAAVKDSFKKMLENGVYKSDLFSDL